VIDHVSQFKASFNQQQEDSMKTLFSIVLSFAAMMFMFAFTAFAADDGNNAGHKVGFAASGLPGGVELTVTWNRVNNGTQDNAGSSTFITPSQAPGKSTDPYSVFTYEFPASITVDGTTYEFVSGSPASGFTTGAEKGTTLVTGTYAAAIRTATVTLGSLEFVYNGLPQGTTATTDPAGLTVEITYDGSTTPPTDAGEYAVVATVTSAGYQGSATGTLHIAKAPLTVTADNQSIIFSQANPTFTFQFSGFVNGETADVLDTLPTFGVGAIPMYGTYPISMVTPGEDNNYEFTYVDGTFTVQPWTLSGFYAPVGMGVLNSVKGGAAVQLKFRVYLGTTELTDPAFSVKSIAIYVVDADGNVATTATATYTTGWRYDPTAPQFMYKWDIPTAPGTTYKLVMTTLDGSVLSTNFKLK
jgi:hypothetical protein